MDQRAAASPPEDGVLLLGRLACALADPPCGPGDAVLPAALDMLVDGLGLRSAVLRSAGSGAGEPAPGALLALAGQVVRAVPAMRAVGDADGGVELAVRWAGREAAWLTVVGARPSQLPVLRACAALFALALAGGTGQRGLAVDLLEGGDADAHELADTLHDGPVQALVAARYAADAVVRGADPSLARDAVQTALVSMRRVLWSLRPRGEDGLVAALEQLSVRLAEQGRPPLVLDLDARTAAMLAPAAAGTAYRLVQSVAPGDGAPPLTVRLRRQGADVVLTVQGAAPLRPGAWAARAAAVGGTTTAAPGAFRLVLPAAVRNALAPHTSGILRTKANP